jgi:glutaconate CoA-transferase subunit B
MTHERRRLVERVSYVTSPGHGEGPGWRARSGLPGGGPVAIVTTLAVLRFPPDGGEAFLASVHPGHTVEEVRAETGWDLAVSPGIGTTPEPTERELAEIRRLDPEGFWTGRR